VKTKKDGLNVPGTFSPSFLVFTSKCIPTRENAMRAG
jgi:hypothetical protein